MGLVWYADMKPSSHKFVLLALADRADDNGYCWPGIPNIVLKTGLSRSTAIRGLGTLESDGWIQKRARRRRDGTQDTNAYRINLAKLESRQHANAAAEESDLAELFQGETAGQDQGVTMTPSDEIFEDSESHHDTDRVSPRHPGGVTMTPNTSVNTSIKPPPLRSNGSVGTSEPPIREEEDFLDSEPETRNPEPDPTGDPVDAPSASQDQNPEPKQASRESSDPTQDSGASQSVSAGCPSEDLPDSPLAEKRAADFVASLDWAHHPVPSAGQLKTLIGPVRYAFNKGWREPDLLPKANETIAKADKMPGVYLKRFLTEFIGPAPIEASITARERSREKWFNGRNKGVGSGDRDRDPRAIDGRGSFAEVASDEAKAAREEARRKLAQVKGKWDSAMAKPLLPVGVRGDG